MCRVAAAAVGLLAGPGSQAARRGSACIRQTAPLTSDVSPSAGGTARRSVRPVWPGRTKPPRRCGSPPLRPGVAASRSAVAVAASSSPVRIHPLPDILRGRDPRTPARTVAALMDPPEGYVAVTCPACGRGYQTLQAAPVLFCSVACADAAHRPATPPPAAVPQLLRAVRCSYCREPMQVAPRLQPPYRCPRCAGCQR
jgi:hypothetical protein